MFTTVLEERIEYGLGWTNLCSHYAHCNIFIKMTFTFIYTRYNQMNRSDMNNIQLIQTNECAREEQFVSSPVKQPGH